MVEWAEYGAVMCVGDRYEHLAEPETRKGYCRKCGRWTNQVADYSATEWRCNTCGSLVIEG